MFTHQIHNPKEVNSSVMKTLIILVLIGSAMLCLQVSGRRLILEEIKKEKANNPNNINGVTENSPKNKPEKSSTYGSPKGGSVPAVEAGKENEVKMILTAAETMREMTVMEVTAILLDLIY
ncbi:hypothetical protein Acr_00g0013560 [Actinidia rufa]|uniref:Uncharacterized protein n=1 Tax=Actinidia rufa TaxID=165716 RepID=A0A7J0DA21_9ERIC|nr:hypothetical protein Acr_00g0013560 [Actinidia rufa]